MKVWVLMTMPSRRRQQSIRAIIETKKDGTTIIITEASIAKGNLIITSTTIIIKAIDSIISAIMEE